MIVALGTIVSSLQSDRLTRRLGTGKVTAVSVAMTAVALWGFFRQQCLLATLPVGGSLRAGRGKRGRFPE